MLDNHNSLFFARLILLYKRDDSILTYLVGAVSNIRLLFLKTINIFNVLSVCVCVSEGKRW